MANKINNGTIRATSFMGVGKGYNSLEAEILTPKEAAIIVERTLRELTEENDYYVYPGLAVYRQKDGCPEAGEPVGVITFSGDMGAAIRIVEKLRKKLEQKMAVIATYENFSSRETLGFYSEVNTELFKLAAAWQKAEEAYYQLHGIDVTCGIYRRGDSLTIQAELNPSRGVEAAQWKKSVIAVAKDTGKQAGVEIIVQFREAGYTCLAENYCS